MVVEKVTIQIGLDSEELVEVTIVPRTSSKRQVLWQIDLLEAQEFGEATVQILEGCSYEYMITKGYDLKLDRIVTPSKINTSMGSITPNIFVGTLSIDIIDIEEKVTCGILQLEVRSHKTDYRVDYRQMLEDITEKCTELLMQQGAPISQYFTIDFNSDARTLYQRFIFIRSILDSDEFNDAIVKILSTPVTNWAQTEIEKDIRAIKRINSKALRQIVGGSNRINLPHQSNVKEALRSIPQKVKVSYKRETTDTPENRFVKYALTHFLNFCSGIINNLKDNSKEKKEALQLEDKLNHFLSHAIFKEVTSPSTLPLNSPVLQRKEGYREIFRAWLMFDLAAKLTWKGGDDVYTGGKKDVATLYEYWLFFKLTDAITDVFNLSPPNINKLIESTNDGLNLKLKQGAFLTIEDVFEHNTRRLNIQFSYNKTVSGNKKYPDAGSWTSNLRPDYTLSVWPYGIDSDIAEKEELIVHIHFDAKYKVENPPAIFEQIDDLNEEKVQQRRGTYKRADLFKMHTYKDAIRRTGGAYIIYPGSEYREERGFHEILPGVGAFSVCPSRKGDDGMDKLKVFLNEIVNHFLNRTSQRERMSHKVYDIHRKHNKSQLNELLPEVYGDNRSLIPEETFVLVGYYKNEEHFKWITEQGLYNTRIQTSKGSLPLSNKEIGARYLLLYSSHDAKRATKLFKLKETGPRIFSRRGLLQLSYPSYPTQEFYLVFEIEHKLEKEFNALVWDVTKLANYPKVRRKLPFSVNLAEVMRGVIKG